MALPSIPKKEPRPVPVSVRLSKKAVEQLKILATEHNMSQADVIEYLLNSEFKNFQENKGAKSKKRKGE